MTRRSGGFPAPLALAALSLAWIAWGGSLVWAGVEAPAWAPAGCWGLSALVAAWLAWRWLGPKPAGVGFACSAGALAAALAFPEGLKLLPLAAGPLASEWGAGFGPESQGAAGAALFGCAACFHASLAARVLLPAGAPGLRAGLALALALCLALAGRLSVAAEVPGPGFAGALAALVSALGLCFAFEAGGAPPSEGPCPDGAGWEAAIPGAQLVAMALLGLNLSPGKELGAELLPAAAVLGAAQLSMAYAAASAKARADGPGPRK